MAINSSYEVPNSVDASCAEVTTMSRAFICSAVPNRKLGMAEVVASSPDK